MDFSKLKKMEQIVGIGAVLAVVSAFLPWYSWKVTAGIYGSYGGSVNGLNGYGWLSFMAALVAVAMIVLPLLKVELPKLGVEDKVVFGVLGGVTAGVPVLAMLNTSSFGVLGSGGPSFGLFGAIAGGAIMLFGAFMDGKKTAAPQAPTE
jgi:hypothetical protein